MCALCAQPCAAGMPMYPTMAMNGMSPGAMMPLWGGQPGMSGMSHGGCCMPPPPKPAKKKDKETEDDPPWATDYWGQPLGPADDKAAAKAYLHQVLNCPSPIVDQGVHEQIKFLVKSACKDQVVSACARFLGCGGVYALRVLEILQHLPAEACVGMLEHLELLSDPAQAEWHFNDGRIITLAHGHKARAAAAKQADEDGKWDAFTSIVGRPRVAWPAPPEQLGWTLDEMYPKWNGDKSKVPPHMMQVLVPRYWMAMAGQR